MSDTLLFLSTTMSNDHERIREIKSHINQLLAELRLMEPNNSYLEKLNSQLTTISHGNYFLEKSCPYLSRKSPKQAILHSTTYNEYKKMNERKKNENFLLTTSPPRKIVFAASACTTSTPKTSSNENILLKPHYTSTPRRTKCHSTKRSTNIIPIKRLFYSKDYNRHRHFSKRSILSRYSPLNAIDQNPQWI